MLLKRTEFDRLFAESFVAIAEALDRVGDMYVATNERRPSDIMRNFADQLRNIADTYDKTAMNATPVNPFVRVDMPPESD